MTEVADWFPGVSIIHADSIPVPRHVGLEFNPTYYGTRVRCGFPLFPGMSL